MIPETERRDSIGEWTNWKLVRDQEAGGSNPRASTVSVSLPANNGRRFVICRGGYDRDYHFQHRSRISVSQH
jgi:hypothetical protein